MIILHYVTAIKIKLTGSLVIIVTWHFVPFSRDRNLIRTEDCCVWFPGIL